MEGEGDEPAAVNARGRKMGTDAKVPEDDAGQALWPRDSLSDVKE